MVTYCSDLHAIIVAQLAAQVICVQLNWKSTTRLVKVNKCYFINTSGLILEETNQEVEGNITVPDNTSNTVRKLLAKQQATVKLQNITAKASIQVGKEKISFTSQCEGAMFKAASGEIWKLYPSNAYNCTDVPAVYLKKLYTYSQSRCSFGAWSDNEFGPPTASEDEEVIEYYNSANEIPKNGFSFATNPLSFSGVVQALEKIGAVNGEWTECTGCCGMGSLGTRYRLSLIHI